MACEVTCNLTSLEDIDDDRTDIGLSFELMTFDYLLMVAVLRTGFGELDHLISHALAPRELLVIYW